MRVRSIERKEVGEKASNEPLSSEKRGRPSRSNLGLGKSTRGLAEFGTNETFRAHLGGRLLMSWQPFAPFSIPNSARLVHWVV